MLIDLFASDRMLGLKAVGIYTKGIEAASAACEKVFAPTLQLQALGSEAEAAGDWMATNLDEMGVGESKEFEMPATSALAMRTACSVYLAQLTKLTEKQADLLVPIDDTNVLISQLQSLADRLAGQLEIPGAIEREARREREMDETEVTFSGPGIKPVKTTMGGMKRAADRLEREAKRGKK